MSVLSDSKCDILTRLLQQLCEHYAYDLCNIQSVLTIRESLFVQTDLQRLLQLLIANASFVDYSHQRAMWVLVIV